MADIQDMYYQVKVPASQISYLSCLWWKEGDINSEIVDHEICVHLFKQYPLLVVVVIML